VDEIARKEQPPVIKKRVSYVHVSGAFMTR
jgi:hypothetical protein